MRNFTAPVIDRIADEALSLVYCFLLQLRTGEQYFYTEGSQSVTVEGVLYRCDPGITVSAIRDTSDASTQTATIEIGYASDMVTEELVRKGGLDGAQFNLGMCDYRDRSIPFIEIFSGKIDRVTASNPYSCTVDLTGWQQKSVNLPGVYSLKCRNVFCDQGCGLNIEDHKHNATMTGNSTDSMTFSIDTAIPEGQLRLGVCEWLTGRNSGVRISVSYNAGGQVKLSSPTPYIPSAGDMMILTDGCDFYCDTCENTYNNLVNFAGEPAVPQGTTTQADDASTTSTQDPYKPDSTTAPVLASNSAFRPYAP